MVLQSLYWGSMWSHLNMHRGSSTIVLILSHWAEFHRLWKRFGEIAKIVIPQGVAMFIEWPIGCRYWANTRVARFLNKYGFTFAGFGGCMYGLVATKGKEAGTPINKPWRVAYLNSSLGTRLNEKCDGSHIHTPCSGQNASITGGYTPQNVRIVHECFRDDARIGKFDVPTYTSAAVHMHNNSILTAAVSRLNPALSIGAQNRANLPMAASWTEILNEMDEAESAAAGDGSVEAGKDDSVAAGDDDRVVAIWTGDAVLDKARFIPDLESKMTLLRTIESMDNDKAVYEWLKNAIYLCECIAPFIKFYYIKMGTITMIARMLDPGRICGVDVEQTMSPRQRCTRASIFFGNVAGELLCTWHTTSIDNGKWVPASWRGDEETLPSFLPFKDVLWMPETSDDLGQVSCDKEGHVLCQEHSIFQPAQDWSLASIPKM